MARRVLCGVLLSIVCASLHADGGVAIANWPSGYSVTGTVAVSNLPASQPVTGTFWPATQAVSGSVAVSNFPTSAPTAVVTRITVGTAAITLAAANASRRKVIIFNETGTLRVKLGPNAGLTDYTYEILASAGNNRQDIDGYSGIITGIKVSGISSTQVTEF